MDVHRLHDSRYLPYKLHFFCFLTVPSGPIVPFLLFTDSLDRPLLIIGVDIVFRSFILIVVGLVLLDTKAVCLCSKATWNYLKMLLSSFQRPQESKIIRNCTCRMYLLFASSHHQEYRAHHQQNYHCHYSGNQTNVGLTKTGGTGGWCDFFSCVGELTTWIGRSGGHWCVWQ